MRVPPPLQPLLDQGVIDDVVRPLMSGKEAEVYLVVSEGYLCVAKIYKEANNRSFKHRVAYTEGRKVRNSRQQRAMEKGTRYGKEQIEDAWRSAEVDAIYRLRDADVRVPEPYTFVDGVLVMELIQGEDGEPAPRLVDAKFTEDEAWDVFHLLLREVVKMLCAGVVHGDLSDFNVLLAHDGPVIIDFPQAIDPANNQSARKLLVRDVNNLASFLARHTDRLKKKKYGEEMWALYESGKLTPESELTGRFNDGRKADTNALLAEIEAVEREARKRREALGLDPMRPARKPKEYVDPVRPAPVRGPRQDPRPRQDGARQDGARSEGRREPRQDGPRRDMPRQEPPARDPRPEGGGEGSRRKRRRGRSGGSGDDNGQTPIMADRAPYSRSPDGAGGNHDEPTAFDVSDDLDAFLSFED
jgi:RIO kinase 1